MEIIDETHKAPYICDWTVAVGLHAITTKCREEMLLWLNSVYGLTAW